MLQDTKQLTDRACLKGGGLALFTSCREGVFSETELPIRGILGNWRGAEDTTKGRDIRIAPLCLEQPWLELYPGTSLAIADPSDSRNPAHHS